MRRFHHTIALGLLVALGAQALGCGTILYPERRGQTSGRIDPSVAILDGIGLLLFLIPGLVAFAVDFGTGAIYLPGGRRSGRRGEVERIPFEGHDLASALEAVKRHEGIDLRAYRGEVLVVVVKDADEARARLSELAADPGAALRSPDLARWEQLARD